jgi:hypothetical protein
MSDSRSTPVNNDDDEVKVYDGVVMMSGKKNVQYQQSECIILD